MNNISPNTFFNLLSVNNDLDGEFEGSVLCVQSTIIPSRASMLPEDIQPRMVSNRDTLILLKPLSLDVAADDGIVLMCNG